MFPLSRDEKKDIMDPTDRQDFAAYRTLMHRQILLETRYHKDDGIWCPCERYVPDAEVVRCNNLSCPTRWYHTACAAVWMGMKAEDLGDNARNWLCKTCAAEGMATFDDARHYAEVAVGLEAMLKKTEEELKKAKEEAGRLLRGHIDIMLDEEE